MRHSLTYMQGHWTTLEHTILISSLPYDLVIIQFQKLLLTFFRAYIKAE